MFSGCVAAQAVLVGLLVVPPAPPPLMMCLLALGGEAASIAGFSALNVEGPQPLRAASFMRDCTVLALVVWAVGLGVALARVLSGS